MKMMSVIFANDYEASLGKLTKNRTMASIPYGGRYRQIDFCLSNMANSGINHVGVITRNNYQSLMNHIGSGQEWDLELGEGKLEFLTPYSLGRECSYEGKIDALYAAKVFLSLGTEDYVLVADSRVICAIDYREALKQHVAKNSDVTVITKKGICDGKKPVDLAVQVEDGDVKDMVVNAPADSSYQAYLGACIIGRKKLIELVEDANQHGRYHLSKDVILRGYNSGELSVGAYTFEGTALFNTSVVEYFENNLALLNKDVRKDLFHNGNPIYTRVRNEVPAYLGESADIDNCVIGDGCVVNGHAEHSILFRGVKVHQGASVKDCVVLQDAVIEEGAEIQYCILDKTARITKGVKICGTPTHLIVIERGEVVK